MANEEPKQGVETEKNGHINSEAADRPVLLCPLRLRGAHEMPVRWATVNETNSPTRLEMEDEDTADVFQRQDRRSLSSSRVCGLEAHKADKPKGCRLAWNGAESMAAGDGINILRCQGFSITNDLVREMAMAVSCLQLDAMEGDSAGRAVGGVSHCAMSIPIESTTCGGLETPNSSHGSEIPAH
ncbi:mCG1048748, partial [Mus musculus]